jgi:hypothetical protein
MSNVSPTCSIQVPTNLSRLGETDVHTVQGVKIVEGWKLAKAPRSTRSGRTAPSYLAVKSVKGRVRFEEKPATERWQALDTNFDGKMAFFYGWK